MASHWPESRFAELLAEPVRNGVYKRKELHGRGAKIVNMGELFAHPRLRSVPMKRVVLSESEANRFTIAKGDLLFARRSLVAEGAGKCSIVLDVNEPTTFESSIIRARPDATKADSLYLYYFFNSSLGLHHLDTIRRQVAVAGITGTDLAKLEIPVPPLYEQRAIAHILGTLDDKIDLSRGMNETLEAMARALFKSWFVDFDPVRAKAEGRDPGLPQSLGDLFPDSFEDSELGEIPRGWRPSKLGSEVVTVLGGTPSRAEPAYWGGGIPWINSGKANEFRVVEPSEFITEAGLASSATKLLPSRTTVIAITGATLGQISLTEIETCANQSIVGVLGTATLPSEFIYLWTKEHVEDLLAWETGGAQQHINKNNVNDLPVLCPSASTIAAYLAVARPAFDRIKACCNESCTLAALRDTLLPKLISGELHVRDAERIAGELA